MAYPAVSRLPSMLGGIRLTVRRMRVAVSVAIALAICDVIMALLPSSDQLAIAHSTSTNIKHLAIDPLLVLPASAFVDLGNGWLWVPLTLILLGGLERKLGGRHALAVAFGAHVVATLVSEGLLLVQIALNVAPRSQVNMLDVGPSYVILAALSGCLVAGGWRLRAAAVVSGMIVIPGLFVGAKGLDMSSVGHLSALILGALFAAAFSATACRAGTAPALIPTPNPKPLGKPVTA